MPPLPAQRTSVLDDPGVKWALSEFQGMRQRIYWNVARYYDGVHPMAFATEQFRSAFYQVFKDYSENLCSPVVDALKDRLEVVGFRTNKAEVKTEQAPGVPGMPTRQKARVEDPEGQKAWDVWTRNRMDLRAAEVHEESLKCGDAYVLVWPNDEGEAEIWPQLATEFRVRYDPNNRGYLLSACKVWKDDVEGVWRLNVYYPDRIDKFASKSNTLQNMSFQPADYTKIDVISNPYQQVPAFHFPNGCEYKPGISELKNVIPIQDGLNKSVVDMLVAMEFASFKQRYAVGFEVEINEETGQPVDANVRNYGVDRMMTFPDPESKVGQFDATDLNQFLRVQDKFWLSAARVSGTPLHYFYITQGDFPSGEAIKSAEGRFIRKIKDRQTANGNKWEDVVQFALKIDGQATEDVEYTAMWVPATPRSEAELADTAVKKRAIGVPRSQLLREQGYSEEEIDQFLQEADAEALAQAQLKQQEQPPEPGGTGPSRDTTRARQGVPGAATGGG